MSKWRKALKNKRRFDARYFLNERVEGQEVVENSVQQEEVKRNFNDFSFDSWLTEAEEAIDEAHCGSHKRDDKVNEGDSTQTILDLIKQQIKHVGFGKETEEDFEAVKIELEDEGKASQEELDQLTFDQFKFNEDQDLEEAHCMSKRDDDDLEEAKGKYDDGDGKDEKCDHVDCEAVDEGHDGAIKGHSEMSPATKSREMKPFDYDKGQIGDEVFEEESVMGKEEKEPEYGESMEELVVHDINTEKSSGSGDLDGMSPGQIRMSKAKAKAKKAREDAEKKGLGPVVDEG